MADKPAEAATSPGVTQTEADMWAEVSAERRGDKPNYDLTPDEPAAPIVAPAAEAAPAAVAAPVITPEIKEILDKVGGFEALMGRLTQEVSSNTGRVAAIQREMAAAKSVTQVVDHAPNAQAQSAAAKDLKKWEQLKNEFPEWAAAIEERVGAQGTAAQAPVIDLSGLQAQLTQQVGELRKAVILGVEEAKIYGAYKNWRDEVKTEPYKAWFNAQPDDVKAKALTSNNADDIIKVLDGWHTHKLNSTRNVAQERQQVLASAAQAPRRSAAAQNAPVGDDGKTNAQIWAEESAARVRSRAARGR